MRIFGRIAVGVIIGAVACWTTAAFADFPNRSVQFVVSAAAGGGNDLVARMIAAHLQEKWGKPVVVLDKPGAGVSIAEDYVAHAAPDGYTVLFVNQYRTINAAIGGNSFGYDMVNGLAAVTQIGKQPFILMARKNLPAKSLPTLMTLAKASPNKLTYGDSGKGTGGDLAMKRLMQKTGTQFYEVPFKTNAEILVSLMGGEIDVALGDLLTSTPLIKAGRVDPLALTDDARSKVFPELPTVAEALGLDSFVYTSWYGVFVPAGTPKDVIKQLNEAIVSVVELPDIQNKLVHDGFQVIASKPEDFEKFLTEDTAVWRGVMNAMRSK